jgi:hypothetical protein
VERVAAARGLSAESLGALALANTQRFFSLPRLD